MRCNKSLQKSHALSPTSLPWVLRMLTPLYVSWLETLRFRRFQQAPFVREPSLPWKPWGSTPVTQCKWTALSVRGRLISVSFTEIHKHPIYHTGSRKGTAVFVVPRASQSTCRLETSALWENTHPHPVGPVWETHIWISATCQPHTKWT